MKDSNKEERYMKDGYVRGEISTPGLEPHSAGTGSKLLFSRYSLRRKRQLAAYYNIIAGGTLVLHFPNSKTFSTYTF